MLEKKCENSSQISEYELFDSLWFFVCIQCFLFSPLSLSKMPCYRLSVFQYLSFFFLKYFFSLGISLFEKYRNTFRIKWFSSFPPWISFFFSLLKILFFSRFATIYSSLKSTPGIIIYLSSMIFAFLNVQVNLAKCFTIYLILNLWLNIIDLSLLNVLSMFVLFNCILTTPSTVTRTLIYKHDKRVERLSVE